MKILIGEDIILNSEILLEEEFQLMGASKVVLKNSLEIENAIGERSTARFVLIDTEGVQRYEKGIPVEIVDDDETLLFAGVIENEQESRLAPDGGLYHEIDCIDWTYKADKRIVAQSYQDMLAKDIVLDLFNTYLQEEGVLIGTIHDGVTITEAVFNYIPVSDAMDAIAEKCGFWWEINADKELNFVERATFNAPFDATESIMRKDTVSVDKSNQQYRNRQYIKGGKDVTDPQTERFIGNGETTTYSVGYPIAKVPTVEISLNYDTNNPVWTQQTVGIRGLEDNKDWYWSKGDNTITQDIFGTILEDTDRIRITYQGEFDIVVLTFDPTEIERLRAIEGEGTGYVDEVYDDRSISSRDAGFELSESKIEKYGKINRILRFQTWEKGLKPGQIIQTVLPLHDLNDALLIDRITAFREDDMFFYRVEAVEGPRFDSWASIFSNLAKQGRDFVIRENIDEQQVLVTVETFTKTWDTQQPNIFEESYPDGTLTPGFYPSFLPQHRVRFMAWYENDVEIGRKPITQQTFTEGVNDELFSLTYLNPNEANTTLSHLGWIGGIYASGEIGTGIEVDKQVFVKTKNNQEAIQVEKTDIDGGG